MQRRCSLLRGWLAAARAHAAECVPYRFLQIRKSPAAPALSFPYAVTEAGVVLCGEGRDAGGGTDATQAPDGAATFFTH